MSLGMISRKLFFTYNTSLSRTFQSAYNVKKLYPDNEKKIDSAALENEMAIASSKDFSGFIPIKELDITYTKSSGPGGQNVNKVNTKVEIRFHIDSSTWIPNNLKDLLAQQEAGRVNKDGFLIVTSDRTRKQILNQADCLSKIRSMLWKCQQLQLQATPSQEALDFMHQRQEKAKASILREKRQLSLKKKTRHKNALLE